MKYVVLSRRLDEHAVQEVPIIFPLDLKHADVAEALLALLEGTEKKVVAAGEVLFDSAPRCFGHSTSLNVASRGAADGTLTYFHDVTHGLETAAPQNNG